MNLINKKVPEFKANAFKKGEFVEITNESLKGHWSVLFFYPADFTFVWPTELGDLADKYTGFKKSDCEIYTVSCDTEFVHMAWAESSPTIGKIEYPMIADPSGKLSKEFGVYMEEAGLPIRGTFIIDPDGVIKCIEMNDLGIGRNAKEILRKVHAAKMVYEGNGEVAPAGWEPGKDSMTPDAKLVGKI